MAFDLLQDFWSALPAIGVSELDVGGLDVEVVDQEVRHPLIAALAEVAGPVEEFDFRWLRERAAATIREDEFCITLDHGTYFADADFQLDLSRTAPDLRHTGDESLTRLPREGADLPAQLAALGSSLATSRKRRVVLADDGISTGTTLRTVISRCRDFRIEVRRIVVCCDNVPLPAIESVRVLPLIRRSPGRPWLNERDLYWGPPRSGLTLAAPGYTIPFSAADNFVRQRIGVETRVEEFRAACLRANVRLWELLEHQADRALYCEDAPFLRHIPSLLEHRDDRRGNTRVIDLLNRLLAGRDAIDPDAPMCSGAR